MLHLNFSGWLTRGLQQKVGKRTMELYLINVGVYLPSGIISTPFSTTFDIRNTANEVAIASHTVVSANCCPIYQMSGLLSDTLQRTYQHRSFVCNGM